MFANHGEINIKDFRDDFWSAPSGEAKRRSAQTLLQEYAASDFCDGGPDARPPLWRWSVNDENGGAMPVHPTEAQFAYIEALIALTMGEPRATLDLLLESSLLDSARKVWRWSDDPEDGRSFEARTQFKYVRVLCALGESAKARQFLDDLRNSELHDSATERWPYLGRKEDAPPVPVYFASDQLAYIAALIDSEDRDAATAYLDRLLAGPLFDGERWISCVAADGQVIDPRRHAAEQLDFVSILARLRSRDAAREHLSRLKTKLHENGRWRAWIDEQGSLASDEFRACDQFRYVQALLDMSDRGGAETALEQLKADFWIRETKQLRASVNKRAGTMSPYRLAADQLRYVTLLYATAPDDGFAEEGELPVMRNF